jgi:hypothetical protein
MKVRMLRNWGWYQQGEVAELFDPVAEEYIKNGFAERLGEKRSVEVERAEEGRGGVEAAVVNERRRHGR